MIACLFLFFWAEITEGICYNQNDTYVRLSRRVVVNRLSIPKIMLGGNSN
jgi:hypothetical protein